MDVIVRVHLERADEGVVWWADSPGLPGFYAAADSMKELRDVARVAISEVLIEGGDVLESISELLVPSVVINGLGKTSNQALSRSANQILYSQGAVVHALAFA